MANVDEVVTILAKSIPFRKEFNLAMKESKETPKQWLARVKTLSELCSFGQSQNLCILDKFLTGFDTEIINHLCSTAAYLDIGTALEITEAYNKRKKCNGTEETFMHDKKEQEACKFIDQTKPSISEILVVKCEDIINDDDNEEFQGENDFFNDNTFDDGAADNNNRDSNSNSSDSDNANNDKDSDFHLSDYEPKSKRQLEALRVKRKYVKKADKEKLAQTEQAVKTEAADPNAPKKKRNYKQRPKKEKETFECDYCHYKNNHKCHLARHMMIHLNQKSFICHECGKGFNWSVNLNEHLRRHAGYKPHVCEVCKAALSNKTKLILHMRLHTGERPYACTICDKRFIDRNYVKIHMRSHTGEKPFKCDRCLRTFAQSSSLSLHKRKSCLGLN